MDEEIKEVLEETIEEESQIKKAMKKAYIIIVVLFLIVLMLANSLTGSYLVSFFSGRVASSVIINNTMNFNNKTIFFSPAITEELRALYDSNQNTEIKMCLTGSKVGNDYFVTGLYMPAVYKEDVFSVTSQVCDNSTIIDLHTHPYLHCIFSNQDMESYRAYHALNPIALMALMCDGSRLSFYGY